MGPTSITSMASTNGPARTQTPTKRLSGGPRAGSSISDVRGDSGPKSPRSSPATGADRLLDESVALDMVSLTGPKVTPQAIG